METVFTAVSDIISTGKGDWVRRGWVAVGDATEMRPDWLGLRHGSLRPLWSSVTSWGKDKDRRTSGIFYRYKSHRTGMKNQKHHTFTLFVCSVGPCGPTVPPGTPWSLLEGTGSGIQRSPLSPCRPWPGPATGTQETCWRKSKTRNPPNVPAQLGQMLTLTWPRLQGKGSEPLHFHPDRARGREMIHVPGPPQPSIVPSVPGLVVKCKLMIVFYKINIQADFKRNGITFWEICLTILQRVRLRRSIPLSCPYGKNINLLPAAG